MCCQSQIFGVQKKGTWQEREQSDSISSQGSGGLGDQSKRNSPSSLKGRVFLGLYLTPVNGKHENLRAESISCRTSRRSTLLLNHRRGLLVQITTGVRLAFLRFSGSPPKDFLKFRSHGPQKIVAQVQRLPELTLPCFHGQKLVQPWLQLLAPALPC